MGLGKKRGRGAVIEGEGSRQPQRRTSALTGVQRSRPRGGAAPGLPQTLFNLTSTLLFEVPKTEDLLRDAVCSGLLMIKWLHPSPLSLMF